MRLVLVAGFLGSGKTSLILEVARRLVAASHQVAVIENEIGDVGIDGSYLADHDILVRELFGGCVCCSLSVDLVQTLKQLRRAPDPDYVLLEPTGIAQPSDLVDTVRRYATWVDGIHVITLLDAERYEMLAEVLGPLLSGQIADADVVAINKIDAVEPACVERVVAEVRAVRPLVPVVRISTQQQTNLDEVMRVVT
jgi:G3E family GTPase